MAWWRRRKGGQAAPGGAAPSKDDARRARKHFTEFAASRRGVEAFVEPLATVLSLWLLVTTIEGSFEPRWLVVAIVAFALAYPGRSHLRSPPARASRVRSRP